MMKPESRRWVVDAIEEGIAAIEEEGALIQVPLSLLPEGVKENDVLTVESATAPDGTPTVTIRIDRAATEAALRRSREQVERPPRGKDPGGPIRL